MLPDIKYFQVNWVDGMKISSGDFIALENAIFENVRDARALRLNEFEYGLLPTNNPEVDNYPKLDFDYSNSQLVLKECRAITSGGQRIEITEGNFKRKKFPAEQPAVSIQLQEQGKYDVYISVDTAVRQGAGEFASNNPPRYSVVSPKYELSVRRHDGQAMAHDSFLKISEIEILDGKVDIFTRTGKYIPPCTSVNTLSLLQRIHKQGEELLKAFVQHHTNLANKVRESSNKSAHEARTLTGKIIMPIVSSLSYYKYLVPNQPPISMIVYFKDYFRLIKFHLEQPFQAPILNQFKPELLELLSEMEKKEPDHSSVLNYFYNIIFLLEKLDLFLAELTKNDYDAWSPAIQDFNQSSPIGKYFNPEVKKEESKKKEREF